MKDAIGIRRKSHPFAVSPSMSLLQISLVVKDLESTIRDFEEALGLQVAFRDPGVALWGLENAVLPMGTTFIELLSPTRDGTAGGRHLDRHGGDGGYMVILQTDDLDAWRGHLERVDVRIAWEGETRDEANGLGWAGLHLHPHDTGGMMISFDRPDPADSWAGAGPHWRNHVVQHVVDALAEIEVESADPGRLAERWAEVLGRPLDSDGRIVLDHGGVSFADARAEDRTEGGAVDRVEDDAGMTPALDRLARVSLRATDRARVGEQFLLGGVSFLLV